MSKLKDQLIKDSASEDSLSQNLTKRFETKKIRGQGSKLDLQKHDTEVKKALIDAHRQLKLD